MKPRILISRSLESRGLYEAAVEKAGGEPLSFHCPDPEMDFDGLILAGGGDMDPSEFSEKNIGSYDIDIPRDKVELALVSRCVNEGKPILGICRGHQVVNIALGGSIYQDLNPNPVGDPRPNTGRGEPHSSHPPVYHDHAGGSVWHGNDRQQFPPPGQFQTGAGPLRHRLGCIRGDRGHAAWQPPHLDSAVPP